MQPTLKTIGISFKGHKKIQNSIQILYKSEGSENDRTKSVVNINNTQDRHESISTFKNNPVQVVATI